MMRWVVLEGKHGKFKMRRVIQSKFISHVHGRCIHHTSPSQQLSTFTARTNSSTQIFIHSRHTNEGYDEIIFMRGGECAELKFERHPGRVTGDLQRLSCCVTLKVSDFCNLNEPSLISLVTASDDPDPWRCHDHKASHEITSLLFTSL